ncbi:MAG: cytochrome c [Bacteroidetes bacterium]|nr:cytochrome c [Bacteroidota bacterium]
MLTICFALAFIIHSCKTKNELIIEKSGAQLWGENCGRCHNTPDPTTYTDEKWETVAMHMKVRANISSKEIVLIKEFLKSANGD